MTNTFFKYKMLTLYTSDSCKFCDYTKSLLKLYFDKDSIKIDDVKNLTLTYSKVPVIKVDSEFINNYNDFEDFIKQLSHLTKLNISFTKKNCNNPSSKP